MGNFATMAKRIRNCRTRDDFVKAEQSLMRLYDACVFSANEFARLDGIMVDRMIEMEIVQ